MAVQLVGAGLGRTGTMSLKLVLEQLLGGTCHHLCAAPDLPVPDDSFPHTTTRAEFRERAGLDP
jgi:hypothetical protein